MSPHDAQRSPRIGVVTVSYGSGAALDEFLATLREFHDDTVPVVVVDNRPAGEHGVASVARRYQAHYLPLPENPGYGAGMNAGVRRLQHDCDAYFFCNPDVRFIEPAIAQLAACLLTDARAGSVGPRMIGDDGVVYPSAREIPSIGTGVGHALCGRLWPGNPWSRAYRRADDYAHRRGAGWLSGAAVLVRREAYETVHGWDEAYFLHFEDIDLGYRLGLAGYTNVFEPAVTVVHAGGHSLRQHARVAERAMTASAIRFMSRRYAGFRHAPTRLAIVAGLRLRGILKYLIGGS